MILRNRKIFVLDVWDGKLADELRQMSLGLTITTAPSGYQRRTLHDFVAELQPVVVVVATPCLSLPIVTLYESYHANKYPPMFFVVRGDICNRDQPEWDLSWPHRRFVLHRNELSGLVVILKIHELTTSAPSAF